MFALYDIIHEKIKKYKNEKKEREENEALLNQNPYYALE
jgi:hypothetical protein